MKTLFFKISKISTSTLKTFNIDTENKKVSISLIKVNNKFIVNYNNEYYEFELYYTANILFSELVKLYL